MDKTIDILLATYNGEKYIKEQIESILNQTYKNIRIIISDDCSKDGTTEILSEFEKIDSRIVVYYQKENLGYIRNFEFLVSKVQSEMFMLSDQDDVWLPEKIQKSVELMEKKNADLVFGDLEVVDENLKTIYPSFGDYMLLNRKIKKCINSYKVNYLYNCVTGCTTLVKSKWIEKILPIPSRSKYVPHDYWIGIMVALEGKLAYLEKPYIKYRQHGNNQIGTNKISHKFTKLKDVRDLFINVKLGVFGTFVENNKRFSRPLQELNLKAFNYYKMLEKKKNFNFEGWSVFNELYKNETFLYYIENFIILNLPFIGKILFKIRHCILKILGKR